MAKKVKDKHVESIWWVVILLGWVSLVVIAQHYHPVVYIP